MILRIAIPLGLWTMTVVTAVGGFYSEYQNHRLAKELLGQIGGTGDSRKQNLPVIWERQLNQTLHARTTNLSFAEKRILVQAVLREALAYDVDPFLLLALIETESSYRREVVSNKGAVGLMQLRPFVAKAMAIEMGGEGENIQLTGLSTNVRLGSYYLAKLLRRFDGDLSLALEAYNQGPTRLTAKLNAGSQLKWRYASKVLGAREKLKRIGRAA